jgi:hypothetical protein
MNFTSPALRGSRPMATRASVDLPEPDSPTTATVSPRRTSRLTSLMTFGLPG